MAQELKFLNSQDPMFSILQSGHSPFLTHWSPLIFSRKFVSLFSLDLIVAPAHAWSLSEKSGTTIYADFGSSISSLSEGIEYEWGQVNNKCLNIATSCEADSSPTLTRDCTVTGKVYPWGTFTQCG